jgi:hypothetical protein
VQTASAFLKYRSDLPVTITVLGPTVCAPDHPRFPDDALAVERSPQVNREGGARRYREMKTGGKPPKAG